MTTITRQQMIAELQNAINDEKMGSLLMGRPMLESILAELQKVDERTLPELSESYMITSLHNYNAQRMWHCHIEKDHKDNKDFYASGKSPREAVLNAISKIPTDEEKMK